MPAPRRLAWIAAGVIAAAAGAAAIALRGPPAEAPGPGPDTPGAAGAPGPSPVPRPGLAPGASSGSAESAAELVASARAAVAAGDLAGARARLARAYALDPAPAVLLEVATAEREIGRCREARRAAQRVIDEAPAELAARGRQLLADIGRCD